VDHVNVVNFVAKLKLRSTAEITSRRWLVYGSP